MANNNSGFFNNWFNQNVDDENLRQQISSNPQNIQQSQNFPFYPNTPFFQNTPQNFHQSQNYPFYQNAHFFQNSPQNLQQAQFFMPSPPPTFSTPQATGMPPRMSNSNEISTPSSVSETQLSQSSIPIDLTTSDKETTTTKGSRAKWTKAEDELLTRSFVTIGDDKIIGNAQKLDAFWDRVVDYYNSNRTPEMECRNSSTMKGHWYNSILKKVNHFNACYNSITNIYRSGSSDADILDMANEKYKEENNGAAFKFGHVWNIVKDRPLFSPQSNDDFGSSKKARTSDSDASNSSSTRSRSLDFDLNINDARPSGQKMAKRKGKASTAKGKSQSKNLEREYALQQIADYTAAKNRETEAKNRELHMKECEFVVRDTSNMTNKQREAHELACARIYAKWASNNI